MDVYYQNIIDSTTYSNEVKQCIKQLLAEVNSNPNVINSQIVECSIVDYGNKFYWLPIKILNNNYAAVDDYKTAIKLSSILFADIDLQDAAEYNRTHVGIVKYSKEFKDIRRLLNRYIVEKFINNYEHTSIVDVFDSENYFVAELYILGCVKNIFCINDNSHSIINYVDALIENKNSQTYNSLLLTTRNEVSPQAVSLKTVEYNMANIKSDIYNKLLNVTLFNINSVDTFILSNNVNKVFTNILNVFALIDVMKFTLTSTGRLLLSFIDNDVEYGNVKKSTKLNFLTYNNKAYANDQHVTVINDDDIRYKGKVYSNIIPDDGYKYPKYSIIPYSAVEHMPVLPMSKMVIHKLAQMFGIDFQYYTSIYTRVLKQFVGVCDYDNTLGAMKQSIFLRTTRMHINYGGRDNTITNQTQLQGRKKKRANLFTQIQLDNTPTSTTVPDHIDGVEISFNVHRMNDVETVKHPEFKEFQTHVDPNSYDTTTHKNKVTSGAFDTTLPMFNFKKSGKKPIYRSGQ